MAALRAAIYDPKHVFYIYEYIKMYAYIENVYIYIYTCVNMCIYICTYKYILMYIYIYT